MECHKTTEHILYPIFYNVEPSEVRNQTGAVGEAFARHEKKEADGEWRKALKEAADVAEWELIPSYLYNILSFCFLLIYIYLGCKRLGHGLSYWHEAKLIRQFVEQILLKLHSIKVYIDKDIIGMENRISNIVPSIGTISNDVRMMGSGG